MGFARVGHKHLLLSFLESLCPFIICVLNFVLSVEHHLPYLLLLCDDVDLGVLFICGDLILDFIYGELFVR